MIRIIFSILIVFIVATFCTVNREEITIRYFFGWETPPFPIFVFILATLVAGMVVGFSVGWGERWKLGGKARVLTEKVRALREEVKTLEILDKEPPIPSTPEGEKSPPALRGGQQEP